MHDAFVVVDIGLFALGFVGGFFFRHRGGFTDAQCLIVVDKLGDTCIRPMEFYGGTLYELRDGIGNVLAGPFATMDAAEIERLKLALVEAERS